MKQDNKSYILSRILRRPYDKTVHENTCDQPVHLLSAYRTLKLQHKKTTG